MSRERKKPAGRAARSAEASLNDALNDLEQILEKRKPQPKPKPKPKPVSEKPASTQYDIPLLDKVILPGRQAVEATPRGYKQLPVLNPGSPEYEEACKLLVAKIANEIEVIVQSRIEAALQSATDEIRKQVKNHIEIMLPEILDEITQERERKGE